MIAFVRGRETAVLDLGTGVVRVVDAARRTDASGVPVVFFRPSSAWSPDSTRLALWLNPGVRIVRADGTGSQGVVPGAHWPSWSPSGDELAVQLDGDIVVVDASGTTRRTVVGTAMSEVTPAWSPDGRWIAYGNENHYPPGQAYQAGHAVDVFVIRPDGTGRRSLTGGCGITESTPLDWLCAVNGRLSVPIMAARATQIGIGTLHYPRAVKLPVHVADGRRYVYGARVTVKQVSGPRVRVTTMWKKPPTLLTDTGGRAAFRFLKPARHGTIVLRVTAAGTTRLVRIRV
jgi:hypothetical protein